MGGKGFFIVDGLEKVGIVQVGFCFVSVNLFWVNLLGVLYSFNCRYGWQYFEYGGGLYQVVFVFGFGCGGYFVEFICKVEGE